MSAKKYVFVCPDVLTPVGGIKMIYELCDEFIGMGLNAVVVHQQSTTIITWFEYKCRIGYNSRLFPDENRKRPSLLKIKSVIKRLFQFRKPANKKGLINSIDVDMVNDIFIYPERLVVWATKNFPNAKIICFNQNVYKYLSTEGFTRDEVLKVHKSDILGHFVVSDNSMKYMQKLLATNSRDYLFRFKCYVDTSLFKPGKKNNQICYMPRKKTQTVNQVLNFIESEVNEKGWILKEINRVSQGETAKIMSESKLFLSFSETEGFGLPPVEAMSAGCCVLGFHGEGGREYFEAGPFIESVESDNILEYVLKVAIWIDKLKYEDSFEELSFNARRFVENTYSSEKSSEFNRAQIHRLLSLHLIDDDISIEA